MLSNRVTRVATLLGAALVAACAHAAPPPAASAAPSPPHPAVARAAGAFAALEKAEVERLSGLIDGLLSDPSYAAALKARDREALFARAQPKFERLKAAHDVTQWYFVDPEPARTCFLRVHAPTLFGEVNERETLTQAIATKEIGYGKELGKTAFALRVVKPVRYDGAVIGYIELGMEIGRFLVRMKEQTGDDFGVLVDKRRVDRVDLARIRKEDRWDERPDVVLIDSTIWNERLLALPVPFERIPDSGIGAGEWTDGGRRFVGGAFPIRDAAQKVAGVLYVRHQLAK